MIDFSNLTQEQKVFFNDLWKQHQAQAQQTEDSSKSFDAYIANVRNQEQNQAQAAEVMKAKMV